ncbi:hypothetical protein CEP52_002887 [Fusarium oligoseptatum]|uniref:Uncharacterized protein n=1 Tax=Fusarium oligoseptatum TaxID=2604345 RepID=A0A428UBR8_9HYPO|nr:hypothetical protein CEP52_002887 [Fusarium oligoseptatum]
MSEDYWDPAALLRIGRGSRPGRDGYSCVALSSACDTGHRERRPKILRLLNQLSRSRPETTSSVILDQLAGLCLCTEHEEDAPDVVADWESIIDLANQHHRHLLRFDLADKRAEIEALRSKLDWVNRFLTWKNKDLADQLAQQGWSSQVDEHKGIKEISELRRSNKTLQAKGQQFLSAQDRLDQEKRQGQGGARPNEGGGKLTKGGARGTEARARGGEDRQHGAAEEGRRPRGAGAEPAG